ncbi:hypothetical protein MY04_1166 [Flammeovirga sp. MY04]|uniref:hypothetical protein n=1 Tax=Flammeovirga sp. MY04 TaxID=1191459 RepID=UPI0008063DBC|nr:hypothetical protein [Flammeovirga sp. MY04]ANQ48543.1 hypothetical protein MY04_1166 [Flammeovirga sp. MY04]
MMQLIKGITGFSEVQKEYIDNEIWKQTVQSFFSVKAEINFSDRYSFNYHIIEYDHQLMLLFKNKFSNLFAVAEVIDDSDEYHKLPEHRFINHSDISDFLEGIGFECLDEKFVNYKISASNSLKTNLLEELTKEEQDLILKKDPETIGNIIFNDWKKSRRKM